MDRGGKAVVYKRYIDDPNFRDNLEAILERLEAQETTSPLELGASIMQAYSHTRFEVSQVLFRLSRWENLEYAKKI